MTSEFRFIDLGDGVGTDSSYDRGYWEEIGAGFDSVLVISRLRPQQPDERAIRIDGFAAWHEVLPSDGGLGRRLRRSGASLRSLRHRLRGADVLVVKMPGIVGPLTALVAASIKKPYGVYVVGDAWEVFSRQAKLDVRLREALRWVFAIAQWLGCRYARAALYVTPSVLQARYPVRAGRYAGFLSEAKYDLDRIPSAEPPSEGPIRLVTVASMDRPYKRIDVLLEACVRLRALGLDLHLTVVGGGRLRRAYEDLATALGIDDLVTFTGVLPRQEVWAVLQSQHVFVLASATEGLPRALVEAMAMGLACVASAVGGIKELLDDAWQVPVGDPQALAARLLDLAERRVDLPLLGAENRAAVRRFFGDPEDTWARLLAELETS